MKNGFNYQFNKWWNLDAIYFLTPSTIVLINRTHSRNSANECIKAWLIRGLISTGFFLLEQALQRKLWQARKDVKLLELLENEEARLFLYTQHTPYKSSQRNTGREVRADRKFKKDCESNTYSVQPWSTSVTFWMFNIGAFSPRKIGGDKHNWKEKPCHVAKFSKSQLIISNMHSNQST